MLDLPMPSKVLETCSDHPALPALTHQLARDGSTRFRLGTIAGVKADDLHDLVVRLRDLGTPATTLWIARGLSDAAGDKLVEMGFMQGIERLVLGGAKLSAKFIGTLAAAGESLRLVSQTSMKASDLGPLLKIKGLKGLDVTPSLPQSKIIASTWTSKIEKKLPELDTLYTYGLLPSWEEALAGDLGARLRAFGAGAAGGFAAAEVALGRAQELEVLSVRDARASFRPASWPAPTSLRSLWLQQNTLDDQAVDELFQWPALPKLETLVLGDAGSHGIDRLVERDDLALRALALTCWSLDAEAMAKLSRWPGLARLDTLVLSGPKPDGLKAFAKEASLSNLRWFQPAVQRTSANADAADEALAALRDNASATSLEHALP